VDRDPTEVPAKQEVQGREVAEAHKDLAVGSKSSLIQQVKQACATVTTPEGEDSLNVRVFEVPHQFFRPGDVVTGHVVRIDNDEVLVDIGYKSEGVIPSGELSIRKSVDPSDEVQLGEEVDALVLTKEDQDGRLILSKKRARFEKAWRRIEAAAESGEPVKGTVIEVVKGGLIIDLGVRGFLPASLVDIRRVPNLSDVTFMGQILTSLGAKVKFDGATLTVQAAKIRGVGDYDLIRKMRGSICILGPLIGRLGRARVSLPGGCVIGPRPIDLHLKGLNQLGARITIEGGYIRATAPRLAGGDAVP